MGRMADVRKRARGRAPAAPPAPPEPVVPAPVVAEPVTAPPAPGARPAEVAPEPGRRLSLPASGLAEEILALAEGTRLMAMPWGIVSLVDLYVGFALFSCWIVFREKAWLPSVIWVGSLITDSAVSGSMPRSTTPVPPTGPLSRVWA